MEIVDSPARERPAASAYPVLGDVPAYVRDRLGFFAVAANAPAAVRCRLGSDGYVLNDPDDVRHVLATNHANYAKARRLAGHRPEWRSGRGLLTSTGAAHLRKRRMLQPIFREALVQRVAERARANADELLDRWRPGTEVDVAGPLMDLAQRNIFETLLGSAPEDRVRRLADASRARRRFVENVYFSPFPFPEYLPTPTNAAYAREMRRVDPAVYAAIAERRRARQRPDDLLTMLMDARDEEGRGLGDRELRDEILTLALTGHETVGEALAWTLYLLAEHPDAAARVSDDGFALRVLKESMRLFPPTWIYARVARVADELPSGARVSPGTMIYLSPYALHRSPRLWPDPERFDPDRFLPEAVRARPRYAYFPFGGGPHVCIGESIALAQILAVLGRVVARFRFTVAPAWEVVPEAGLTLRPRGGLPMRLEER